MVSKKGAIELSMTTIIVIVIGITLLTLGLTWVRGVFTDLEGVTEGAFEQADAAIGDLSNVEGPLTITPNNIDIEQNGAKPVKVIIANFEEETITFQGQTESTSEKLECLFADTKTTTSKEYTIASGKQAEITLIVDEKNGPLGIETCGVIVAGIEGDNQEELIVEVVKK